MKDINRTIVAVSAGIALLCPSLCKAADRDKWLTDTMPQQWRELAVNGGVCVDSVCCDTLTVTANWWDTFGDPMLTSLISRAKEANYDVLAAVQRVNAARQNLRSVKSGYFPTIGLAGSWTKGKDSGKQTQPYGDGGSYDYFTLGLNASWEADVFGRIREQAKGARATLNAKRADVEGVMLSVETSMAQTYFNLRMYQEQLEVALAHIDGQERVVALTEARFEAGLVSALDVAQAKNVLLSTKSTIPRLKAMIESSLNSIAILMGIYPYQLPADLRVKAPMPSTDSFIEIGVPADMIRRRPDIISAQYQLEALAAQVGIAKKEFLPSLTISGNIGTSAHRPGDLFSSHSLTYSVSPQLSWTVFDGMARSYAVAEAKANLEAAVDSYNSTVMSAIVDVNNDLTLYSQLLEENQLLNDVCDQSRLTLNLAVDRYKLGLSDFTNVANAQMSLLEDINSLISSRGKALDTLVSLYEALGGGWTVRDN